MKQRVVTGLILAAVALVLLWAGGVVLAGAVAIIICFAVHEEFRALTQAGHKMVEWPTWACAALGTLLVGLFDGGVAAIAALTMLSCMATLLMVTLRADAKLEEGLMSLVPVTTVVLPGMGVMLLSHIEPKSLQVALVLLLIAIPCVGDIFAMLTGSKVGGPKLCPVVSPNKTISGAIGGLVGSVLAALLVCIGTHAAAGGAGTFLPSWWECLLLGLIGGVVGQVGDLFASMVKRHAGVKDFSNLFPGHGGMLDRFDSILFMSFVMMCYCMIILP